MDAMELTKVVNQLTNDMIEIKKEVSYLTQELKLLQLKVSDLQIDVKMLDGGVAMDKAKLSKLRHEGHITDAEYKEMIRMCDRDHELIRKFREIQQTALKKGYTPSGGYCRGVTDCLRVILDEYEVPEVSGDFETRGCCT